MSGGGELNGYSGAPTPFAETYTMRSKFYRDLGSAAKQLADTYAFDTDLENRAAFKELVWDAVCHSLVEHHGFNLGELG